MSSRVRVTKEIEEGYNFDVDHQNWSLHLSWRERIILFLIMFLPTVIINVAYMVLRDIILSQMLFQLTLIVLPAMYDQFFPLNLDILYIKYVKHVPKQVSQGTKSFFVFLICIPGVAMLLRNFDINILEGMILLIPSGLSALSRFQRIVHFIYFALLTIVFGIMSPIAEFRYYLVFLQSKFKNSKLTYIFVFLLLSMNYSIIIYQTALNASKYFTYLLIVLVLLGNYRLLVIKDKDGIITTLLRQIGINLGIIITMILCIYSSYIIQQRHDISLYVNKNAIDRIIDGFIWDDPNYDSSM